MLNHFNVLPGAVIGKRNAGIHERVLKVEVGATVKLVGAALGSEIVDTAIADASEFGREVRCL